MINRLHGPVSDVSKNDWTDWEVKAQSEIALITSLSEDWNLERADTWGSSTDKEEELTSDPNETHLDPKAPHMPWIVVGWCKGMISPTSESCPWFNSAAFALLHLGDTRW